MSTKRTMQALVNYAAQPGSVELREVPMPVPGPEDVLLKVGAVGICGSDVHQWRGSHSWPVNYPCTLGHEFAGTIVERGQRARRFNDGARVVSETAAVVDPGSPFVRRGDYQLDPRRLGFGYGVDGAMAEYVCVPERLLHPVPLSLSLDVAALAEPCCVAYSAVCANRSVQVGDNVLVIGPGPIGLLCALLAKLSGANHVILAGTPRDEKRLHVAQQMGVDQTVVGDPLEAVMHLGDGLGVEVVVDAAGVSPTLEVALAAVRPGGRIVKVGWGKAPLGFSLDPLVQKAITLTGSFSHNWPIWDKILRMLSSGQLDPRVLVSRVVPLKDWAGAFDGMYHGSDLKVILHPNGPS